MRVLVVAALTVLLVRGLGSEQWERGIQLVREAGWSLLLVVLATPVALACDAIGWRQILRNLNLAAAWPSLTRIRLISEAVLLGLPGGSVMAEATKLALLSKSARITPAAAAASLALARALHILAAGAYLGLIAILAATLPDAALAGRRATVVGLALTASLLTALAARFCLSLLREARLAARLADRLQRAPWKRLAAFVGRHRRHLDEIDRETAGYFKVSLWARTWAGGPFFLQWLVEGIETIVILHLLGADIGWRGALIVDGVTSFARAVVVVVPAGLGVQEGTQVIMLRLMGASGGAATAAALIFIKRMKELFWILAGAILAATSRSPAPPAPRDTMTTDARRFDSEGHRLVTDWIRRSGSQP